MNETAFNYNGNRINIIPQGSVRRPLALPSTASSPDRTRALVFRRSNWAAAPERNTARTGLRGETWRTITSSVDDVSWTHGAHQFKFGASWALYKKVQDIFASTQGNFNFNGFFTGNDFADFLLGDAASYNEDAVHDAGHWNNQSWAAYFQDNWRVNSRLTLNLGLRWDGIPHTYEANHRTSNFYPALYDPAKAAVFNPGQH